MMNESKFDMKSAYLIRTLLLIYYLFFTLESSPMHSYVYIPLSDKVCLIEKYIPQEYPIASRIPIFMYDSFESCIAACSSYSTGELLCNAFMYSDITKACHLHFYALHLTAGMCPVETGQSQFYLHHGCLNRSSTLLNAGVNEKNEADDKIIVLPDLQKSCLIRKRHVSESFFAKITAYMTATSLKKCLSRCIVKGAEACNSVIFSLQEKSCTLVTHQSTFSALSETVQSSAYFFEIHHCKTKVIKNPLLMQILSQNPTILTQFISGYSIQQTPITESENATIIDLLECTTMQCCLQCCILKRVALGCNAIFFNAKEKTCLLMKLNVNSSNTAELVLYNLYADTDGKEKLILSNYEDTLRFKTSFVSLHEFHERCQIATFTSAYAENLKMHPLVLQANTLNGCLNFCRSNKNDIFNCSGVLFSKQEETCYQLVEGTSHDQIVTSNGQTIVLLQRCVKDREEERRNNNVFFFYSIYELEEKCVFEFYEGKNFSGFEVYDSIQKANTLYQCVLKCASEQISKGCAAVLKSHEMCLLFKRNSTARMFRKLDTSYFGELLYCESKFAGNDLNAAN
ncbi:ATP phosphoribosyltransferase regulatory subunit [Trichinella spiralis]|uniref:ATP phosphoribosyltransferase regulatory subunit n=1 Tax=Trichinella spiralis TaxID=6334 RepID=A0ABR3KGH1_TRISP